MKSSKFKSYLSGWWRYLLIIIASVALWSYVFSFITALKPEEKVTVFIGSYVTESNIPYEYLDENKPEYLKAVEVSNNSIDPNFGAILKVFGYGEADILILPESKISKDGVATLYSEISDESLSLFPDEFGYFLGENGKTYGIKVYDAETKTKLISFLDYVPDLKEDAAESEKEKVEDYYLLFNKNSLHLGSLAGSDNDDKMNGAITIAQKLFDYEIEESV